MLFYKYPRDQENLKLQKNLPGDFQKVLGKIFSSNKIREYLYQTFFTKPVDYQISLKDHKEAIYEKEFCHSNQNY